MADLKNSDTLLTAIVKQYRPYDTIDAFGEGFVAHQVRFENLDTKPGGFWWPKNPYDRRQDAAGAISAQAWDRGLEAASRYQRARQGLRY